MVKYRVVLVLLFGLLVGGGSAGVAFAHAYPVFSQPAPDTTVAASPAQVQISFDENLEPRFSNVAVYDARRQDVTAGPGRVDPTDLKLVSAPLRPKLPAGTYTVVWHVVSADDGHSTAGVFAFGVGVAPGAPVVSPQQLGQATGQEATAAGTIGRWLTYVSLALLLGASIVALLILPVGVRRDRLRDLYAVAVVLLAVGEAAGLVDETALASIGGGTNPAALVLNSRFGLLWLGRVVGLGIAAVLLVAWNRASRRDGTPVSALLRRRYSVAYLVLGLLLAVDLDWSGHAAAGLILAYARLIQATLSWGTGSSLYLPAVAALVQVAPALTLILNGAHLIATSVWIGGLITLAVVFTRVSDLSSSDAEAILRFSRVATAAIGVVLLTGLYNTWLYLSGLDAYTTTGYGRGLLVKHAAILALLFAAASSHFVTTPLLARGRPSIRLPRRVEDFLVGHPLFSVRVEAVLGVLVLLSTGLLTSLGPTRTPDQILHDPRRELTLATVPLNLTMDLGRREQAVVRLDPGRVGPNHYLVSILQNGVRANDARRVYLELTPIGAGPAATAVVHLDPTGAGLFAAEGPAPSSDGLWRAGLRVYRSDGSVASSSATFQATRRWAAVATPEARTLLGEARDAMIQLRSARMVEQLGNGAGGVILDDYTFVAPNNLRISGPRSGVVLQLGDTEYRQPPGSSAWRRENASSYVWPEGDFDELTQGVGGIVVGDADVLGYPCTIVAFYSPRVEGIYEEWIGKTDHRVHQEVMDAPAHFMVNLYYDFDAPIHLTPPRSARRSSSLANVRSNEQVGAPRETDVRAVR